MNGQRFFIVPDVAPHMPQPHLSSCTKARLDYIRKASMYEIDHPGYCRTCGGSGWVGAKTCSSCFGENTCSQCGEHDVYGYECPSCGYDYRNLRGGVGQRPECICTRYSGVHGREHGGVTVYNEYAFLYHDPNDDSDLSEMAKQIVLNQFDMWLWRYDVG